MKMFGKRKLITYHTGQKNTVFIAFAKTKKHIGGKAGQHPCTRAIEELILNHYLQLANNNAQIYMYIVYTYLSSAEAYSSESATKKLRQLGLEGRLMAVNSASRDCKHSPLNFTPLLTDLTLTHIHGRRLCTCSFCVDSPLFIFILEYQYLPARAGIHSIKFVVCPLFCKLFPLKN